MKLFEYMAKEIFRRHGLPVPDGYVVESADGIKDVKNPVVVKSQVLIGGRGKAGGIKFAENTDEAREHAAALLGSDVRGYTVKHILIEDKLDIKDEFYISVMIDRSTRMPLLIASADGGVEIESVPEDRIFKRSIDPTIGYNPYIGREMTKFMGLTGDVAKQVSFVAGKMYEILRSEDAELVEINPLVLTGDGKVMAADGKMTINDDSLFRHPEYKGHDEELTPIERKARERGIAFVQLDGDIGVIANGAGLTMATLDSLSLHGGKAGVFLDLGGTDSPEMVKSAFELMMEAKPKVVFINIFGGITKSDTVATGLKEALGSMEVNVPIVARIKGVNEEAAIEILSSVGITAVSSLAEAAEIAVRRRNEAAGGD